MKTKPLTQVNTPHGKGKIVETLYFNGVKYFDVLFDDFILTIKAKDVDKKASRKTKTNVNK